MPMKGQTFSSAFNFAPTAGYKVIDVIITVLNLERGPEYHSSWQIFKNTICFRVCHFAWSFLNKNLFVLLAYQPQRPINLLEIRIPIYMLLLINLKGLSRQFISMIWTKVFFVHPQNFVLISASIGISAWRRPPKVSRSLTI